MRSTVETKHTGNTDLNVEIDRLSNLYVDLGNEFGEILAHEELTDADNSRMDAIAEQQIKIARRINSLVKQSLDPQCPAPTPAPLVQMEEALEHIEEARTDITNKLEAELDTATSAGATQTSPDAEVLSRFLAAHASFENNVVFDWFVAEVAHHSEETSMDSNHCVEFEPGVVEAEVVDSKLWIYSDVDLPCADEALVAPWRYIVDNDLVLESLEFRSSTNRDSGLEVVRCYAPKR